MAVGHLTYLNIDPKLRRKSLAQLEDHLRSRLASPDLTTGEKQQIRDRLIALSAWAKGATSVTTPSSSGPHVTPRTFVVGGPRNTGPGSF